jgi:2Fe-2S ferredoxin
MATIRLLPLGEDLPVDKGSTVMGAAQALGYYWPTTCGGEGRCTTCACEVLEGGALLSEMGKGERATLTEERGAAALAAGIRLACQARVIEDGLFVIRKAGVRRPE